jgi:hypothetical protein
LAAKSSGQSGLVTIFRQKLNYRVHSVKF